MERSPEELRAQFYAALDQPGDCPDRWLEIWQLYVEHPWYQAELHRAAERLVQRTRAPPDWADDIAQDAMLLLGRRLQHDFRLNVDRALAAEHFSGWLATIIARDCLRALANMRRREQKALPLPSDQTKQRTLTTEALVELDIEIETLPDLTRRVVQLYSQGYRFSEIAIQLGISQSHAHRALHEGLELLGLDF